MKNKSSMRERILHILTFFKADFVITSIAAFKIREPLMFLRFLAYIFFQFAENTDRNISEKQAQWMRRRLFRHNAQSRFYVIKAICVLYQLYPSYAIIEVDFVLGNGRADDTWLIQSLFYSNIVGCHAIAFKDGCKCKTFFMRRFAFIQIKFDQN